MHFGNAYARNFSVCSILWPEWPSLNIDSNMVHLAGIAVLGAGSLLEAISNTIYRLNGTDEVTNRIITETIAHMSCCIGIIRRVIDLLVPTWAYQYGA